MPKISLKKTKTKTKSKTKSKSKSEDNLNKRLKGATQLYLLSLGKKVNDDKQLQDSLNKLTKAQKKDTLDRYRSGSMSEYKGILVKGKKRNVLDIDNAGIYTFDKAHNINKGLKPKKTIEQINKDQKLIYIKDKPKNLRKKNQKKNPNIPKIKIN